MEKEREDITMLNGNILLKPLETERDMGILALSTIDTKETSEYIDVHTGMIVCAYKHSLYLARIRDEDYFVSPKSKVLYTLVDDKPKMTDGYVLCQGAYKPKDPFAYSNPTETIVMVSSIEGIKEGDMVIYAKNSDIPVTIKGEKRIILHKNHIIAKDNAQKD